MRTWVLLRGLMRETRHWGDFVPKLQACCPQDQIICLEWPGNGALAAEPSFTRIEYMGRYIEQSLDKMALNGPYHVIAISLGGMAALQWAYQSPTQIASCTLINTSLRRYSSLTQRLQAQNCLRLLSLLFLSAPQRERHILALTSATASTRTLQTWQRYAQQYSTSNRNVLRQLWAASRYNPPPFAPSVPLLLLNSRADRLVDPACSEAIAQAWQCPLQTHAWAGHDLPLDDPDWVLAQIMAQHGIGHAINICTFGHQA